MKDFLACDEIITLVCHAQSGDSDSYLCYTISGASWYEKTETAISADGAKPVNVIKVRIPESKLPPVFPEKLDYIVKGEVTGIERPADLKNETYFQITAISDNRRGRLPHVLVSGT